MAFSILSLGMFAARAFWITRRSAGLVSGLGPPALTAMARSLPIRVKAFAILSHRLNIVAFLVSKIRPMGGFLPVERLPGKDVAFRVARADGPGFAELSGGTEIGKRLPVRGQKKRVFEAKSLTAIGINTGT